MGLFTRNSGASGKRAAEANAAEISRANAAKAAATGKPVYGIDADGWKKRADTFQAEADRY